ncbi:unnamed protein product [Vitrella brassicaformis CCMP3155]|uniref:Uncharacterized protein n=2 Tax=Vitrella brassicaformis TaxID=1169539 RepID=A0A0G4GY33_VITBC|nr:unnamed protein product [Vitrella brassicaformis CCMP3155]|eukprot:CEM35818.1 unnamed protein product [Vitrella brassicaformis CCMP3155]
MDALLGQGKYDEAATAAQAALDQLSASPDATDAALFCLRRRGLVCILVKARLRCKTFSDVVQRVKPLREATQEEQALRQKEMAALAKEISDAERMNHQAAGASSHSSARVLPSELLLLVESLIIHADLLDALGRTVEAAERCEWLFTVLHLLSTACPASTAATSWSQDSLQEHERDHQSTRDHRYVGAAAVVENAAFMPAYHYAIMRMPHLLTKAAAHSRGHATQTWRMPGHRAEVKWCFNRRIVQAMWAYRSALLRPVYPLPPAFHKALRSGLAKLLLYHCSDTDYTPLTGGTKGGALTARHHDKENVFMPQSRVEEALLLLGLSESVDFWLLSREKQTAKGQDGASSQQASDDPDRDSPGALLLSQDHIHMATLPSTTVQTQPLWLPRCDSHLMPPLPCNPRINPFMQLWEPIPPLAKRSRGAGDVRTTEEGLSFTEGDPTSPHSDVSLSLYPPARLLERSMVFFLNSSAAWLRLSLAKYVDGFVSLTIKAMEEANRIHNGEGFLAAAALLRSEEARLKDPGKIARRDAFEDLFDSGFAVMFHATEMLNDAQPLKALELLAVHLPALQGVVRGQCLHAMGIAHFMMARQSIVADTRKHHYNTAEQFLREAWKMDSSNALVGFYLALTLAHLSVVPPLPAHHPHSHSSAGGRRGPDAIREARQVVDRVINLPGGGGRCLPQVWGLAALLRSIVLVRHPDHSPQAHKDTAKGGGVATDNDNTEGLRAALTLIHEGLMEHPNSCLLWVIRASLMAAGSPPPSHIIPRPRVHREVSPARREAAAHYPLMSSEAHDRRRSESVYERARSSTSVRSHSASPRRRSSQRGSRLVQHHTRTMEAVPDVPTYFDYTPKDSMNAANTPAKLAVETLCPPGGVAPSLADSGAVWQQPVPPDYSTQGNAGVASGEHGPDDASLWLLKAGLARRVGAPDAQAIQRAKAHTPAQTQTHESLGVMYECCWLDASEGRVKDALYSLDQLLVLHPHHAPGLLLKARLLMASPHSDETAAAAASSLIQQTLNIDDMWSAPHFASAEVLEADDLYEDAFDALHVGYCVKQLSPPLTYDIFPVAFGC